MTTQEHIEDFLKIIFACLISRLEKFPGLVQLHHQEQVTGPGTS